MLGKKLVAGFGMLFEPTKTTSGQRFFRDMYKALENEVVPFEQLPKVLLLNISAPWYEFVKAKWRRQKLVVRVDGLWMDRISSQYLQHFSWPMRTLLRLGLFYPRLHDPLAHFANFLVQNYTAFFRIAWADHIIYQSRYSQVLHQAYFSKKSSNIIVNGSTFKRGPSALEKSPKAIKLIVIYSLHPSKRIYETIQFVRWLIEEKGLSAELVILGYTGEIPEVSPRDMKRLIENSSFVRTLPWFDELANETSAELFRADCYLCFSERDPCPNAVVESMAHGLPVVGLASGGIPDIVGDAGELVPVDDFINGFFSAHRWEYDFAPIDFDGVYKALQKVLDSPQEYRLRVEQRFLSQLDISVTAKSYANVLREVGKISNS